MMLKLELSETFQVLLKIDLGLGSRLIGLNFTVSFDILVEY